MNTARELRARSPAKINLTLRVGPPRSDGFHPIDSLVTKVDLCDEITVRRAPTGTLTLACDDLNIPCDATNLMLRAAAALQAAAQSTQRGDTAPPMGAAMALRKRIPMGAGLGGGSSNAATTLRLLNDVWELNLSIAQLAKIGATLGSDVPLFLYDGICRITGRGEIVTPLGQQLRAYVVLILPDLHCATPAVYRAFDALPLPDPRSGLEERILALLPHDDAAMPLLFNDLEPAAFAVCPQLAELAGTIRRALPGPLCMSGSGSTLFRLFASEAAALKYGEALEAVVGVRFAIVHTDVPASKLR